MPSVLGYWKIRGLAQGIRLLLEYCGEDYKDVYYELNTAMKCPEWTEGDKNSLNIHFPNLPYYIDGDTKLVQSNVILRYLAEKYHLAGDNSNKYEIAMNEQNVHDLRMLFSRLCYNDQFETMQHDFIKITLPAKLRDFSKYLGNKTWLAGDKITYPDFNFYDLLDSLKTLDPSCLDNFENLREFIARFEALPKIAEYLQSPRFLKSPLNNKIAKFGSS